VEYQPSTLDLVIDYKIRFHRAHNDIKRSVKA
jgi:hypothetical protein